MRPSPRSPSASRRMLETLGVDVVEGPNRWTPGSGSSPPPLPGRSRTRSLIAADPDPVSATLAPWWVRPGLDARDGRLTIAGEDAEALAREHGTPLFVYDRTRFAENARRLAAALDARRPSAPAPLRAQGAPGPAGPRGASRPSSASMPARPAR